MQSTKRFVFLISSPALMVKVDQYHVLCVSSVTLSFFVYHLSLIDLYYQWNLKEVGPCCSIVSRASFHVLHEYLRWMEHLTEFTLHRYSMLNNSRVQLERIDLGLQCFVAFLNHWNCIAQSLVRLSKLINFLTIGCWFLNNLLRLLRCPYSLQ